MAQPQWSEPQFSDLTSPGTWTSHIPPWLWNRIKGGKEIPQTSLFPVGCPGGKLSCVQTMKSAAKIWYKYPHILVTWFSLYHISQWLLIIFATHNKIQLRLRPYFTDHILWGYFNKTVIYQNRATSRPACFLPALHKREQAGPVWTCFSLLLTSRHPRAPHARRQVKCYRPGAHKLNRQFLNSLVHSPKIFLATYLKEIRDEHLVFKKKLDLRKMIKVFHHCSPQHHCRYVCFFNTFILKGMTK